MGGDETYLHISSIFNGRTSLGHDFGHVYKPDQWKHHVEDPLGQFAAMIYCKLLSSADREHGTHKVQKAAEECRSRALPGTESKFMDRYRSVPTN